MRPPNYGSGLLNAAAHMPVDHAGDVVAAVARAGPQKDRPRLQESPRTARTGHGLTLSKLSVRPVPKLWIHWCPVSRRVVAA